MDGRTFRYHDNHEFFRSPTAVESGGSSPLAQTQTLARKRPKIGGQPSAPPPAPPGEHHRHCTAGEIASELGYSVMSHADCRPLADSINSVRSNDNTPMSPKRLSISSFVILATREARHIC